jgi:hypothetical protein
VEAKVALSQATNRSWRRRLAIVPIIALAVGAGAIVQKPGWNETSHYALVRSLHNGTAQIDPYASDTGDSGRYKGHWYSNKAPGLALFSTPFYSATRALGIGSASEPHEIHLLAVFGSLVPFAVLLLLIDSFVERIVPGAGTPTAMLLGLGSLLLPFSTLLFSHMLAACLGFAAYYLLWLQRHNRRHLVTVVAAGLLSGFAITCEYPQGLLAVILAAYALGKPASIRRLVLFGAGVIVGAAPLLAYNWWAFGSPLRDAYVAKPTSPGGNVTFLPFSLHGALDLLFAGRGLMTVTPVLAAAVAGIVLLYRRGRRGEAVLAGTVALGYLIFNASYYMPFGGWSPGPRYLIDALPFLALPLAAALRRVPGVTLALGAVSAANMFVATVTVPELPDSWSTTTWWNHLAHGMFAPPDGLGQVVWFGSLAALAVVVTATLAPRPRIDGAQLSTALLGLASWLLVVRVGVTLLRAHSAGNELALIAIVAAASLLTWRAALEPPWRGIGRLLRAGRAS